MKMMRLSLSSPGAHPLNFPSALDPIPISMCTPWNTYLSSDPWMDRMPLLRKMSWPLSRSSALSHPLRRPRSSAPPTLMPTLVTVSSCMCVPSTLRNSSSISTTVSKSNARMPMISSKSTTLCCDSMILARLLMVLILAISASFSASVTRSTLFSRILSANATCSTDSFSTPSGFSSIRCCITCLASTTVRMASKRNCSLRSSSTKNVCATGAGSANPVVSMRM
mmetsp:Transcript_11646/g.28284  ORF Transcript_11646/g.28284 Transcript_11646/m.28284 type:complete len:224 (-) Transcript_11646:302-973(-)